MTRKTIVTSGQDDFSTRRAIMGKDYNGNDKTLAYRTKPNDTPTVGNSKDSHA